MSVLYNGAMLTYVRSVSHRLIDCCLTSHGTLFYLYNIYGNATVANCGHFLGTHNVGVGRNRASPSCRTSGDLSPRFLPSHPKDHPINRLLQQQEELTIYTDSDLHSIYYYIVNYRANYCVSLFLV